MNIMFDVGHGGTDPGAIGNGLIEKAVNLQTAKLAATLLQYKCLNLVDAKGEPVKIALTRDADETLVRAERLRRIASFNPAICISFHHDASPNITARGSSLFHSAKSSKDDQLAKIISDGLKLTGMPSRGLVTRQLNNGQDYYYIIRDVMDEDTIALLCELAFLTNVDDADMIKTGWTSKAADAISKAVFTFIRPQLTSPAVNKGPGVLLADTNQFFQAIMSNGSMYIPARLPLEALGHKVEYDSTTRIATVRR